MHLQTAGGGLTTQMDCDSEGHCSSLLPPKGKTPEFDFPPAYSSTSGTLIKFYGVSAVGLWVGHLADLIPDEPFTLSSASQAK